MKYMRQFCIILGMTCLGELLHYFIPLPIPGSIYGLVLLFLALLLKIIPLESVKETGEFLISIMPLMFIPAASGLLVSWDALHITDPVAKGLAVGTSSHAIGTAKAIEMGETEGAMSSLAIVVCGLMTVIGASLFSLFY